MNSIKVTILLCLLTRSELQAKTNHRRAIQLPFERAHFIRLFELQHIRRSNVMREIAEVATSLLSPGLDALVVEHYAHRPRTHVDVAYDGVACVRDGASRKLRWLAAPDIGGCVLPPATTGHVHQALDLGVGLGSNIATPPPNLMFLFKFLPSSDMTRYRLVNDRLTQDGSLWSPSSHPQGCSTITRRAYR